METAEREKAPMLWYWSIPENGMDIEDCEKIAKENLVNRPNNRYAYCFRLKSIIQREFKACRVSKKIHTCLFSIY